MEDAANNIVAHYERHALSWDADRRAAAWTDKPYIERFLEHLPAGAAVLDLGCGGGDPVALHMVARDFTGDFARGGRASWLARAAHAARWP